VTPVGPSGPHTARPLFAGVITSLAGVITSVDRLRACAIGALSVRQQ